MAGSYDEFDRIVAEQGRLDVVVHNAGHMVLGPAEEQFLHRIGFADRMMPTQTMA